MKPGDGEELRRSLLEGGESQEPSDEGTLDGDAADAPAVAASGRGRAVVRGIGEVFLTVGAVMLLMVAYQLWWTNVESSQAIAAERDDIIASWGEPTAHPTIPSDGPSPTPTDEARPTYGTGFALLYIPRLRDHVWGLPIMQGTGKPILAKGAGHYRGTAMPGEVGNFAIAAHRSTHSEPFANFPDLQKGDKVYVQTRDTWYVYTLTKDDPTLKPTDTWVILPVPGKPGARPTQKLITMTTCTPRYGSTGRWAWWGELTKTQPSSDGAPDGLTGTA